MTFTMVWTVTYRTDSKSAQCELKRYTKEAADYFAEGIIAAGGVAVITEDIEPAPATEPDALPPNNTLDWN